MSDAFELRGYVYVPDNVKRGGTAVVRKYKKGKVYYAIKEIKDNSDYPLERITSEVGKNSGNSLRLKNMTLFTVI